MTSCCLLNRVSLPDHPADRETSVCEEGLLQLHGVTQPAQPLHRRGELLIARRSNKQTHQLEAFTLRRTSRPLLCVPVAGGWDDPFLRGHSEPVGPQQADDLPDEQRAGQEGPRGLHPDHVQDGRPAHNNQK